MANTFGKQNAHSVEIGRRAQPPPPDPNSDKYRITCAHVHIIALACAMVGAAFYFLVAMDDLKKGRHYIVIRHIASCLLFGLVILGNRLYKPFLYLFYLIFNFMFVLFVIGFEIVQQYKIRTSPTLYTDPQPISLHILIWSTTLIVEMIIYYIIYKDYRFVKDVERNPPAKIQSIRQYANAERY